MSSILAKAKINIKNRLKKKKKVSFTNTIDIIPPYPTTDSESYSESYNDEDLNEILDNLDKKQKGSKLKDSW